MKYMGSKRTMLRNGLGEVLLREAPAHERFFDLFTGSGAVAAFVAARTHAPVHARDLQAYGAALAAAVVCRTRELDVERLWRLWRARARDFLKKTGFEGAPVAHARTKRDVEATRRWCRDQANLPLTRAYGGHYYSGLQAAWLDALRETLPRSREESILALAALIDAASECAASPGHTAQPFQPTRSAKMHLFHAWDKSVLDKVGHALARINSQVANTAGSVSVGDALGVVDSLQKGDLAFIDPPYSAVHYSRFYHVLESVAIGRVGDVDGVGRYPAQGSRPRSSYSVKREASAAMSALLAGIARRGADAIVTFPNHACSNGLSGEAIITMARDYFEVTEISVKSKFSTLGGVGTDSIEDEIRGARRDARELIILMRV